MYTHQTLLYVVCIDIYTLSAFEDSQKWLVSPFYK